MKDEVKDVEVVNYTNVHIIVDIKARILFVKEGVRYSLGLIRAKDVKKLVTECNYVGIKSLQDVYLISNGIYPTPYNYFFIRLSAYKTYPKIPLVNVIV